MGLLLMGNMVAQTGGTGGSIVAFPVSVPDDDYEPHDGVKPMDRREFLRGLRKPALALAAVPVVAAAADKGREAGAAVLNSLKKQLCGVQEQYATLKDRLDKMEVNQKRTMRIVLAISAITLGVDVSLLM